MRRIKSLLARFAGTTLLFSAIIGVGTSLVLLAASCVGFLPYSDRPGPGWWGKPHFPSWTEVATYIGFAPWFAYGCLYFGLGLFVLSLALGIASTPRWLNRLIGGIIAAIAAMLAVAAAGWYLALAAIGPYSAAGLGLLYGSLIFPRFVRPKAPPAPMWIRIGTAACASVLFLGWIFSPLLPKKPVPEVRFNLIRVTPGESPVKEPWFESKDVAAEVSALHIAGKTHGGIGGGASSGQGGPEIDVDLIALEPIGTISKLDIPKSGYVVYVLQGGKWTANPSFSKKDGRQFTIGPGNDLRFDGGKVKFGNDKEFKSFTWYPTIPKGQ
ncbi:MAG: hypothetical protein WBD98_08435 [Acidobacteriaceae bacterium]